MLATIKAVSTQIHEYGTQSTSPTQMKRTQVLDPTPDLPSPPVCTFVVSWNPRKSQDSNLGTIAW